MPGKHLTLAEVEVFGEKDDKPVKPVEPTDPLYNVALKGVAT